MDRNGGSVRSLRSLTGQWSESQFEDRFLFHFMSFARTRGGAGCGGAFHGAQDQVSGQPPQARQNEMQPAHVRRLFLHPNDFPGVRMAGELGFHFGFRKRIELIEEDDSSCCVATTPALGAQLVTNLPAGEENSDRPRDFRVGDHRQEPGSGKIGKRGNCVGMAKHAFRCEDHQRFHPVAKRLTA